MNEKILVYDIETAVKDGIIDATTDKLKFFGCYSYITNKYYYLTDYNEIRKIVDMHDYMVGFNTNQYDAKVMYYNGFDDIIHQRGDNFVFKYKTNIDMFNIFKKRANIMKIKQGMLGDLLMSYSLDYISKTIGIVDNNTKKIENFDYSVLNKDILTKQETKYIIDYLHRDLEITKKMYEWLEDFFKGFKPFLEEKDIKQKTYLTSSPAVFVYKAICKATGLKEEYNDGPKPHTSFGGGYVGFPAGEHFSGEIYCLDVTSMYPSIMHQCNIYSPANLDEPYWNGNGIFEVVGKYKTAEQGKVEKLLKNFYEQRLEFKKTKDEKEYSLKIILNTSYGILGNESFKNLSSTVAASDVTRIGRQWIKLARHIFREAGYEIIYSDTDSVYLVDPFSDKNKLLQTKDKVISTIKDNVPFPYNKFDMSIDEEITDIWFFKGSSAVSSDVDSDLYDEEDLKNKELNLMKKNYIFLTTDGKIKVKNLGVRKKSTSALSLKIFWDYIVPRIKQEKIVKFDKDWFIDVIDELLNNDLSLISKRFRVSSLKSYNTPTSIQAQIAKKYGEGIHFLISNKKFGIGKSKKYCTIQEFRDNNLNVKDIDLSPIWSELDYFIINKVKTKPKIKNIFDFS